MKASTKVRPTAGQVAHTQRPFDGTPAKQTQRVDLTLPISCFECFDAHFFLPDLGLPQIDPGHPAYEWIQDW